MANQPHYGGQPPSGGTGEIGGGVYTGPKLYPEHAPWTCPACKADNSGPLADGCASCGAGSVKARRADPVERPKPATPTPQVVQQLQTDMRTGLDTYAYALQWVAANPEASLADAFLAGYQYANAKTIGAPPVAVDVERLSPEGKVRRTIVAALQYFREQVLPVATEEVASGEWCSVEEIERLIQQFQEQEER